MDYDVITEDTQVAFVESVQAWLNAGWQLAGGVSITHIPEDQSYVYAQAVTRPKETK